MVDGSLFPLLKQHKKKLLQYWSRPWGSKKFRYYPMPKLPIGLFLISPGQLLARQELEFPTKRHKRPSKNFYRVQNNHRIGYNEVRNKAVFLPLGTPFSCRFCSTNFILGDRNARLSVLGLGTGPTLTDSVELTG